MATEVGEIKYTLDLDKTKFDSKMNRAGGGIKKFAGIAKKAFTAVGIAVAAGLAMSIKRATDFETALSNISTLITGDSTKAINQFKKGILEMTAVVPKSADELGAAAYQIVSAGIDNTTEALKVLKSSAKLAVAGLGTTEEATNLLTSALNAFQIPTKDSNKAANILFKTVKAGKTTVAELAQAFGMVAPIAAANKVGFDELQAATAALTTSGLKTSVAQTQLRQSIVAIVKPTKEMADLIKKAGFESGAAMIKQRGLVGSMKLIKKASKGESEALNKAWGSVEALNAALSLTGPQGQAFVDTMLSMEDGTNAMEEAFEKQKDTFANSLAILRNSLDKIAITVGSKLLPPLASFAKTLAENIGPAIDIVVKFFKSLLDQMGGFNNIMKTLQPSLDLMAIAIRDHIFPALVDIWAALKKDLLPALSKLWKELKPTLIPALKILAVVLGVVIFGAIMSLLRQIRLLISIFSIVAKTVAFVVRAVTHHFRVLKKQNDWMVYQIKRIMGKVKEAIIRPFREAFNWITDNVSKVTDKLKKLNPFSKSSPSLVEMVTKGTDRITELYKDMFKDIGGLGVTMPSSGLASTLPLTQASGGVSNIATDININVNMNGIVATSRSEFRQLGKDFIEAVNEEVRARGGKELGK